MQLVPSVVPLSSGLDLVSPKLLAQPGSLIECLNVEVTDTVGYKTVDGTAKFAGYELYDNTTGHKYVAATATPVVTYTTGVTTADIAPFTIGGFSANTKVSIAVESFTVAGSTSELVVMNKLPYDSLYIDSTVYEYAGEVAVSLTNLLTIENDWDNDTPNTIYAALGLHTLEDVTYAVVGTTRVMSGAIYSNLSSFDTAPNVGDTLTSTLGASGVVVARGISPLDAGSSDRRAWFDVIWDGAGVWATGTLNATAKLTSGDPAVSIVVSQNVESPDNAIVYKAVAGAWVPVTLDTTTRTFAGRAKLIEEASRYQFLSKNFFAAADSNAMYFVNGVDKPYYITSSGTAGEIDAPAGARHISDHHFHLALGYSDGTVRLSVVGTPTDFSGVNGASEFGFGSRVTGILPMTGEVSAIFCRDSVWALSGTTIDSFSTQVISPNTGCIEYTAVDCGDPIYCNPRGIQMLSNTAAYGDFLGIPMSAAVSNYITTNADKIMFAYPCRRKNQYRLWMNDGTVLTMTLTGTDKTPVFTMQQIRPYTFVDDTLAIPFCVSSQETSGGKERMLFAPPEGVDNTIRGVYQLDRGISFSTNKIEWYAVTNWFFENPGNFEHVRKVRVHGLGKGQHSIRCSVAGIDTDYPSSEFPTLREPIDLPRTPVDLTTKYVPYTNICETPGRGYAIQVRFESAPDSDPEPPVYLQVMIVFYEQGGKTDG